MTQEYVYLNLLKEMTRKGDKKKDLCKMLNISYFTLQRKLAGKTQWTIGDIEILCQHYGKDLYELFEKE